MKVETNPVHFGSLLEEVDPRVLTAFTGASKMEPGEEEFCSWRPDHGCGLHSSTWVMDAGKSPGNLP